MESSKKSIVYLRCHFVPDHVLHPIACGTLSSMPVVRRGLAAADKRHSFASMDEGREGNHRDSDKASLLSSLSRSDQHQLLFSCCLDINTSASALMFNIPACDAKLIASITSGNPGNTQPSLLSSFSAEYRRQCVAPQSLSTEKYPSNIFESTKATRKDEIDSVFWPDSPDTVGNNVMDIICFAQ